MYHPIGSIAEKIGQASFTDRKSINRLYLISQQALLAYWAPNGLPQAPTADGGLTLQVRSLFEENRDIFLRILKGGPEDQKTGFENMKTNLLTGIGYLRELYERNQPPNNGFLPFRKGA